MVLNWRWSNATVIGLVLALCAPIVHATEDVPPPDPINGAAPDPFAASDPFAAPYPFAAPPMSEAEVAEAVAADEQATAEARKRIRERYKEVFTADVQARMMYFYAWYPTDYAVALRKTNGVYSVAYVQGDREIVSDDDKNNFHSKLFATPICDVQINPGRAEQILSVWTRVLEQEWPEADDRSGFDTDAVSFSALHEGKELFGSAGSPDENSITGLLTQVGVNMTHYCRVTNWPFGLLIRLWFAREIDNHLSALEERLE